MVVVSKSVVVDVPSSVLNTLVPDASVVVKVVVVLPVTV